MSGKLAAAKLAVNIVGGLGVSKVVNDIVAKNTVVNTTFDAIRVWAGSIVIGSIAAEHASNHVNSRVDKAIDWYKNRSEENEDNVVDGKFVTQPSESVKTDA